MKNIKPDDYFNNGLLELTRFGKNVCAKNNMSNEQHLSLISELKDHYDELKSEIDAKIAEIKKDVLSCNPVQLLLHSSDIFKMRGALWANSEDIEELSTVSQDYNEPYIATEFIQSIYASSPANMNISDDENKSNRFSKIISDIECLMDLIYVFYAGWGAKIKEIYPELTDDISELLFEEQLLFSIKGNRYQIFEKEYFERLLMPHNDVFVEVFGISSDKIIEGITKLQYALSQQKFDEFEKFTELFEKFESEGIEVEKFNSSNKALINDISGKLFGTTLNDVQKITNWTEKLIDELSWEQNSCPEFWTGEYGGWPIIDLPVSKRPFIKIEGKAYCFDYFLFVDNFYRSIQKATTRVKKDYQWSDIQQNTSERMVADIFRSLLPGCETYISNYYPINQSLKQMAENDLIVIYDKTLIIVEVKAGSFVYTSPITDFNAHIKSYKKLIEEADIQCQRTKEYLERSNICKIYNYDKSEKTEFDMSTFSLIYMMSITVDNINEFAAKAEKLTFLNLQSKAISIAIDDLMVYREYFDSPLIFLHFLKQRSLATQNHLIALNDELDHLGMYIKHNCYNFQTQGIKKGTEIHFVGYRDELNAYFNALYHPDLNPQKPIQDLPPLFKQIIEYLTVNEIPNRSEIANYLLDFASDTKEELCRQIYYILNRQKKVHTTIPITASGDRDSLRYTVFVNQSPYEKNYLYQQDYALATLSWNKENDRVLIILSFESNKFSKIVFKKLTPGDIDDKNRERITKLGEKNAQLRILEYKRNNPGKIGRNTLCPCGSGKKYKKCCGR